MPVLTFIHDLLSFTRGPYERVVGRHTRRFCGQAAKKAKSEGLRRVLLVAAVCADETLAAIFGVGKKSRSGGQSAAGESKADTKRVREAMRSYLSALLVVGADHKELLLAKTAIGERDFLRLWSEVFEYRAADMQAFDSVLGPAYEGKDTGKLAAAAADLMSGQLFGGPGRIDAAWLKARLVDDGAAIIRVLAALGEG